MTPAELQSGLYYSNGAYGRTWGVRLLAEITIDESGESVCIFRGVAGMCRRRKGRCSPAEFARWAKYQVVLQENDWKRAGGGTESA